MDKIERNHLLQLWNEGFSKKTLFEKHYNSLITEAKLYNKEFSKRALKKIAKEEVEAMLLEEYKKGSEENGNDKR